MPGLDRNQHYLRTALSLAWCAHAAYVDNPLAKHAMTAKFGWDRLAHFNHRASDTQGFVAANDEHLVVSFRGTEPRRITDWITNLSYRHYRGIVHGGRVHEGFWSNWLKVKQVVRRHIDDLRDNQQTLWFTGHSLGGALAKLAARDMPQSLRPEAVCTFGAPRVGDPEFAKKYDVHLTRYVNEDDIVPHLPFQGLINRYSHFGRGQLILPDGSFTGSDAAWMQMLRKVAAIMVLGVRSLPAKSIQDHSLDLYIKKLADHAANQNHPLLG